MDSDGRKAKLKAKLCKGGKPSAMVNFANGVNDEVGGKEEKVSLLPSALKRMGRKQRNSKSRVRWNDNDGNKLVQVLEFAPSDPSDDEDEYPDTCICTIM